MNKAGREAVADNAGALQKRGRVKLLLLVVFFLLPILIVLGMYQYSVRPKGASHGELQQPAHPLHFAPLPTQQGQLFSEAGLHDKWSLLYILPQNCDVACLERVHALRQVHASLGKEIARVQRIVLAPSSSPVLADLQKDYPDLLILALPLETYVQLLQQFNGEAGNSYLVDPLGNVMMRYKVTADINGIRKDLTRLLHYAWAG